MANSVAYSLALGACSLLARSRSSLRRILPDGFFGMASRKMTPPVMRLIAETLPSMKVVMSAGVAVWPGFKTT